jgi:hypothetical protein
LILNDLRWLEIDCTWYQKILSDRFTANPAVKLAALLLAAFKAGNVMKRNTTPWDRLPWGADGRPAQSGWLLDYLQF